MLLGAMRPGFARTQTWLQAGKYVSALTGSLPSRNGWSLPEAAGDHSPDRMQRLLYRASWDESAAMSQVRRYAVAGLPLDLRFRTKGELAIDILTDAYADGLVFDFICGDEVYGNCTPLRDYLEARGQGYVLRVASSFTFTLPSGVQTSCARAAASLLAEGRRWEVRSAGPGPRVN